MSPPLSQSRRHARLKGVNPGDLPFSREQARAEKYTAKWHAVADWAQYFTGLMDVVPAPPPDNPRVTVHRASAVYDLRDEEEAYDRAMGLESLEGYLPEGPGREDGGRRRVIIQAYTWIHDTRNNVAHHPQWITLGSGFTARSAAAAAERYVHNYANALENALESRRLLVTALEVKWWTTGQYTESL